MSATDDDPHAAADAAATRLAELTGVVRHDVALVLGSGWHGAIGPLGETTHQIPIGELPGFARPTVPGHAGRVLSVRVGAGDGRALVFVGRTHLYEGHGVASVVHGVRTAVAAGCRTIVLTNGGGGLRADLSPGQPVLISDHINLTACSPLVGARFVDMTEAYSARLRALCLELEPGLAQGVYAQLPGPQYETPAEIRMLRAIGADVVGMSTALEAIAAREAGAEVLGISLVTNLAAGMTGAPLEHAEVIATGDAAAERMGRLLGAILGRLLSSGANSLGQHGRHG